MFVWPKKVLGCQQTESAFYLGSCYIEILKKNRLFPLDYVDFPVFLDIWFNISLILSFEFTIFPFKEINCGFFSLSMVQQICD